MIDLQSTADHRNVDLQRVGISRLSLPIKIMQKAGGHQSVAAEASLFVEVPAAVRGTHLSRFVELLTEWTDEPVSSQDIESLLALTCERAHSTSAEAELRFKYFLPRAAPVSGRTGVLDYGSAFSGRLDDGGFRFTLGVEVPITTLCPCSKEISDQGAHNQRAVVRAKTRYAANSFIWLEDLVELIEAQASSPVYPVLKRVDEKFVTEMAYRNPKFVEDVVRDLSLALGSLGGITWFSAECESQESIHNHNAIASAEFEVAAKLAAGTKGASTLSPSIRARAISG
jgi:GTP cyclohydrolase I